MPTSRTRWAVHISSREFSGTLHCGPHQAVEAETQAEGGGRLR